VPRNVEPSARAVAGVRLFDLDDLQQLRCPASGFDAPAIGEAERLLRREIERLLRALDAREVAPRLAQLHRAAERLVEEESERALRELGNLSEQEQQVVRAMAERLVRRVLYPVSRALREESATEAHRHAAAPTEDVSLKV
jgi:glutamyl-tRNA reductase